jgi:hypothetical protein
MLPETIQLETLRQTIEDAEFEAGSQSDYLDRGGPNAAQAKRAQQMIKDLNSQSKASKAELNHLITTMRSQQPQAIEEWVNFHIGILQKIMEENGTDANAATRRNVAKSTLQEWENVRAGKQDYVPINWYFLKDYKASVRGLNNGSPKKANNKAWWQFWK